MECRGREEEPSTSRQGLPTSGNNNGSNSQLNNFAEPADQIPDATLDYSDFRGFPLIGYKGFQRVYGPSMRFWNPPKGCEVCVRNLPLDYLEPQLMPVLEQAGPIFKFRLLLHPDGTSKGLCFVTYYIPEDAKRAIHVLNGLVIKDGGDRIQVVGPTNQTQLALTGVPTYKSKREIFVEVALISPGLQQVCCLWDEDPLQPAGTGVISAFYANPKLAARARNKMQSMNPFQLWGFDIHVDWDEPEVYIPDRAYQHCTGNGQSRSALFRRAAASSSNCVHFCLPSAHPPVGFRFGGMEEEGSATVILRHTPTLD